MSKHHEVLLNNLIVEKKGIKWEVFILKQGTTFLGCTERVYLEGGGWCLRVFDTFKNESEIQVSTREKNLNWCGNLNLNLCGIIDS